MCENIIQRNDIIIKPANIVDVAQILFINQECRLESWKQTDYENELTRKDAAIFLAGTNSEKNKNNTIGFIAIRFSGMTQKSTDSEEFTDADIVNLGVLEKYRNLGAGEMLIHAAVENARQRHVKTIWLEVRSQNLPAIRFYEKTGFSNVQLRNNFYLNPTDHALIMKRDLVYQE